MRHFGRIFIELVIKKILERSKTFQVLMRAIAVIDEESLVKLGSDGGEGISGEGIPVVKFFTQGSVSSLHAAVILGLTGRKNDERDMEICTGLLELSAKFRPPIHLNG